MGQTQITEKFLGLQWAPHATLHPTQLPLWSCTSNCSLSKLQLQGKELLFKIAQRSTLSERFSDLCMDVTSIERLGTVQPSKTEVDPLPNSLQFMLI